MAEVLAAFRAATNVRRCAVGPANRLRELRRALAALWEAIDMRLRIVNCLSEFARQSADEDESREFSRPRSAGCL